MKITFNQRLKNSCIEKNSFLCIGLDLDPSKLTEYGGSSLSSMESFGKEIIDGTIDFCPIYKPNFAFFERFGSKGYVVLENLIKYIDNRALVIADAKRGDIGNTSKYYANSIFEQLGCDAITLSPYMGRDSIEPFIQNPQKGVFVLAVTSNLGGKEIQFHGGGTDLLYNKVIQMANELNTLDNIGLVVGATKTDTMENIRKNSDGMPWLIPGIGSQGGDLNAALTISNKGGIGVVNVSRSILYSGDGNVKLAIKSAMSYTDRIREIICNQMNY